MHKLFLLLILSLLLAGCTQLDTGPQTSTRADSGNVLTIYTYDSMVSEFGWGPHLIEGFQEECGCEVKMVAMGDAGQVLNRIILERSNPQADVVIGIDNTFYSKAMEYDILEEFTPSNAERIKQELVFDATGKLTPYDYGFIAFNYDSQAVQEPLTSLEDLTDEKYRGKILIQNPRTSSPGLALLFWTVVAYGDPGYKDYWKRLKPNILTVTAGWDESFGLFQAGEAPIMLSYATSPAYHAEFEDSTRYKAANFSAGLFMQVEGVGIVKGTPHRVLAERFITHMLSEPAQKELPLNQFMYPVNDEVELPASYAHAVNPEKKLTIDPKRMAEKQEEWIEAWENIMAS